MRHRLVLAFVVTAAALVALAPMASAGGDADQQIADDSVLTIDDVPAGFEEAAPDDDDEDQETGRECRLVRRGRDALNEAPNAESEFQTDENRSALINNKVAVFESAKAAKAAYRAYAGPDTEACFERTYRELFESGIDDPSGEVDVTVDRYDPDLGDAAVGYEIEISASAEGESRSYFLDLEVSRVGRAIDAFAFLNTDNQPPSDDVVAMTDAGVERLSDAL